MPMNKKEIEMADLKAHFEKMQAKAAEFLEPTTYRTQQGVEVPNGEIYQAIRNNEFAADMIYMLDGPEQREACNSYDALREENANLLRSFERLQSAARAYVNSYLLDELERPESCGIDDTQHAMIEELADAAMLGKETKQCP